VRTLSQWATEDRHDCTSLLRARVVGPPMCEGVCAGILRWMASESPELKARSRSSTAHSASRSGTLRCARTRAPTTAVGLHFHARTNVVHRIAQSRPRLPAFRVRGCPFTVTGLPLHCHGVAPSLSRGCPFTVTGLPLHCHGVAPSLSWQLSYYLTVDNPQNLENATAALSESPVYYSNYTSAHFGCTAHSGSPCEFQRWILAG
jgi:hypothetical protein